jgi:hypothetical protein
VFIPFVIGDDCFENVFLVSDQLVEPLIIRADFFLLEYGFTINFKTNCLTYEMEGYTKECKFTNNVEAELKPLEYLCHGLLEKGDDDVMQTAGQEPVSTVRRYMRVVDRNRELYDEMVERETKSLDTDKKSYRKEIRPIVNSRAKSKDE